MRSLNVYIEPDRHRLPQDDGPDESSATILVPCGSCGFPHRFRAMDIIAESRAWLSTLDTVQIQQIKQAFDCIAEAAGPLLHLTYDSQSAYCVKIRCWSCSDEFIACMQFYEKQPMRYLTTLVGAATVDAWLTAAGD